MSVGGAHFPVLFLFITNLENHTNAHAHAHAHTHTHTHTHTVALLATTVDNCYFKKHLSIMSLLKGITLPAVVGP